MRRSRPRCARSGSCVYRQISDHTDVLGFLALLAGCHIEFDLLALVEGLVAVALDVGEMNEDVVTLLARDESESLFCVEELHCSLCHKYSFLRSAGQPVRPARYTQQYLPAARTPPSGEAGAPWAPFVRDPDGAEHISGVARPRWMPMREIPRRTVGSADGCLEAAARPTVAIHDRDSPGLAERGEPQRATVTELNRLVHSTIPSVSAWHGPRKSGQKPRCIRHHPRINGRSALSASATCSVRERRRDLYCLSQGNIVGDRPNGPCHTEVLQGAGLRILRIDHRDVKVIERATHLADRCEHALQLLA